MSETRRRRRVARALRLAVGGLTAWLLAAYLVLPVLWRHYEHRPGLEGAPKVTTTAQGIPGDPVNVGLVGTREEVLRAMLAAGWSPADPVTLRSSLHIAASVLLDRPYRDAPVSPLYLFGRMQDLAFEKESGRSADRRHHVRFWHAPSTSGEDRPIWLGAVTFDRGVGLSHRTGQVTHHIAPDVDAERDGLMADLAHTGRVARLFQVTGVGATLAGWNGGGDRYDTDGELTIAELAPDDAVVGAPQRLPNPPLVRFKGQLWSVLRPLLRAASGSGA